MLAWLNRFLFCAHKWVAIGGQSRVNGFTLLRCSKCCRKRFFRF